MNESEMSDDTQPTVMARGHFVQLVNDGGWEYAQRVGATGVVAVLAVTADDRLVLTEQYRPAVRTRVIDLPAGLSGDIAGQEAEPLSTAALRELEEETGFTADSLRRIATVPSSPGLTSEEIDVFLAGGIRQVGEGGGDEHEHIDVHTVPLGTIADWLEEQVGQGTLVDPKVYAALWWVQRERPE